MPELTICARTVIHSHLPDDCRNFPERLRDMVTAASVGGTGDDLVHGNRDRKGDDQSPPRPDCRKRR